MNYLLGLLQDQPLRKIHTILQLFFASTFWTKLKKILDIIASPNWTKLQRPTGSYPASRLAIADHIQLLQCEIWKRKFRILIFVCMFSEIAVLFIHPFVMDEILQIFQIFFGTLVILYEVKKKIIHLFVAFLKVLIFFLLFDNFLFLAIVTRLLIADS